MNLSTQAASLEELVFGHTGALPNPSKAFETIFNAMKASDGWSFKQENKYYYVILAGPYTGTYEMGPRSFWWHDFFKLPFGRNPNAAGLRAEYHARVMKRLKPLQAMLREQAMTLSRGMTLKEMRENIAHLNDELRLREEFAEIGSHEAHPDRMQNQLEQISRRERLVAASAPVRSRLVASELSRISLSPWEKRWQALLPPNRLDS